MLTAFTYLLRLRLILDLPRWVYASMEICP